jgi:hypothetical protein
MIKPVHLWLLLPVFLLTSSTTCNKTRHNPPPRVSMVNPFNQYLHNEGDTVSVSLHPNELPVEIGYSFTVSDSGTVYQLGVRLPDTGKTYTVTLWDGATQAVLARQNITVLTDTAFTWFDLTSINAQVSIYPGHTYVISAFMVPVGTNPAAGQGEFDFYDVERRDQGNIFPMTEGVVTYMNEYTQTAFTPTFPGNLSEYQNFINGIVDIGFSYIE